MSDLKLLLKGCGFVFAPLFDFLRNCFDSYRVVSIVGGGGKTSLMIALKDTFVSCGYSVMLTTTTHLSKNVDYGVGRIISGMETWVPASGESVLLVREEPLTGKFCAPDPIAMKRVGDACDKVIIEADGSKGLPLKYHNDSEPVVLDSSEVVVSVLGLDSLGAPIADVMHRYELYEKAYGASADRIADCSDLERIISDPNGSFRCAPDGAARFMFLNKADSLYEKDLRTIRGVIALARRLNCSIISIREGYAAMPIDRLIG